jgi:hypothetical protein
MRFMLAEARLGGCFRERREYIPVGSVKNVLFFTVSKGPTQSDLQLRMR